MGQTWTEYPGSSVTCPICKAEFAVRIERIACKDRDSFNCTECGAPVDDWNTTELRFFTLIKPGKPATPVVEG